MLGGIQGTRSSQADPCPPGHPLRATGEGLYQQTAFVAALSPAVILLLSLSESLQEFLTSLISSHATIDQVRVSSLFVSDSPVRGGVLGHSVPAWMEGLRVSPKAQGHK